MRVRSGLTVRASGTLTAALSCLFLGANTALAQYTLDVPGGATVDLSPGEHTYDLVRIDGTLRLSGDTRIIVTGRNQQTRTVFTMTGNAANGQKARIVCSPADMPPGASGADGARGADGYVDHSGLTPGGPGQKGGKGGNGADGAAGTPGWKLTLIIQGDAVLEKAELDVKGGSGGSGGNGGAGGDGGSCGWGSTGYTPVGDGGDGGNGGSGAPGGDGGRLQVFVSGSLTLRQTGWFVSGGDGGGGGWPGMWGTWGSCAQGGGSRGQEGYGGRGEAAGKGGSIVLDVGADLTVANSALPATDPRSLRENQMAAQGGWGGSGSRDYSHGSAGCLPGATANGGSITVRVRGQLLETNYPIVADGGRAAIVYSAAPNVVGPAGGIGGAVHVEAYGGITSSTGQLHFGSPGGLGSSTVGSLLWTPADSRARPGPGGDGGAVTLRAPVIADHALPLVPGVPGGSGGVDNYDGSVAATGTPGTVQIDLTPPVFAPELRVYYNGTEVPNAAGVVDLGSVAPGAECPLLIRNTGTAPLSLANLNVPAGYQVVDGLAAWVLTGEDSDTLILRIPIDASGAFRSTVRFESNDARSPVFTFLVTGTATGSAISTSYTGPSATGSGMIVAGFTGGGGACTFSSARFLAAPPGSGPVPSTLPAPGVAFPHGMFAFATSGCAPGATLTFTLVYPQSLPPGTVYWKFGPTKDDTTPHWYQLPATIAGRTATFSIADGGLGDDDLDGSNGIIIDQGGPGAIAGGDAASIPALDEAGRTIFFLLVALLGFDVLRRRRGLA